MGDRPVKSSKSPSARALEIREKFSRAIIYAKAVIDTDDELKAAYGAIAEPGQSAFNMAFADYMKAPVFNEEPSFPDYHGEQNATLSVMVTDDFRVESVTFSILDAEGAEVESGQAVGTDDNPLWIYQTTTDQTALSEGKIRIVAKDLPGNETVAEVDLA